MKKLITIFTFTLSLFTSYSQSVGIGTNAPNASAQLDVTSTSKGLLIPRMTTVQRTAIASPAIGLMVYDTNLAAFYFYNGSSWNAVNSGGSGSNYWTASGNNIYNSNTGNVGIGIAAPAAKLHLAGLMKIDGGQIDIDDNIAKVRLIYNGSPKGYFQLGGSSGNIEIGTNVTSNATGKLYLETQGFPRFTILPEGNVGIGTINPQEKLQVVGNIQGSGRIDATGVMETSGGLSAIQGAGLYVTGTSLMEGNITASSNITSYGTGSFNGNINSNTSMTITDAAAILSLKSNSSTEKGFVQLSGDDVRVGTYSSNTLGKFQVRTAGADNLTVASNGNVGIGTETPVSKLHVAGRSLFKGVGEVLAIDGTSNPNIGFYTNGVFKSFISQSSSELFIGVNNANLHLDAGQIAIGAVIPAASGYKLTVTGKVICEELKVQLQGAWPDYVFQNKYNLMPMPELRNFINTNNHLPNIPAAAAIEKSGMEVGEMQRKMMEKIEELTLYILQLEEKVNALSKK
jgi:hypothetical protein